MQPAGDGGDGVDDGVLPRDGLPARTHQTVALHERIRRPNRHRLCLQGPAQILQYHERRYGQFTSQKIHPKILLEILKDPTILKILKILQKILHNSGISC